MSKLARLLMPLALLNLWDAKARPRHGLMLLGFTLTFLLYFGLTWHKPFHTGRYFSAWWPWAIYFLAAAFSGLEAALRKLEFPWPRAAAILALVFGGFYLNLQFQNLHYYFSGFEKENYRAAVKHLQTTVSPGARWVVTGPWQKNCFRYYDAPDNFFTPEQFDRPGEATGLFYVGLRPPQDELMLARLGLNFVQVPWEIKSLNYYVWRPPAAGAVGRRTRP
ncbi:MAG: hypothetical protein HGA76_05450 [Candidatus Firestonebacteria bacterium]|nr:hypothetical protein [Candidatus Firestonebacteria bacterium]